MELSTEQIEFIYEDVESRGLTMDGLIDSLVDHICCVIENSSEEDFNTAYSAAIKAFGDNGLQRIETETKLLLTLKKEIFMKGTMFLLGYIALFLSTSGFLFKTMHWPGANIMLVMGIVVLNLGFLPLYFYDRYKRSIA